MNVKDNKLLKDIIVIFIFTAVIGIGFNMLNPNGFKLVSYRDNGVNYS